MTPQKRQPNKRRFDPNFFSTLPSLPGVYFIWNSDGGLIYIGKAKNLRRRLGQYKNAKRCRKHRKMRQIMQEAARITYELAQTAYEAELLELKLIQTHQPKWNVAGAFFFLYPLVGIKADSRTLSLCYTTEPELWPEFNFHGAFRSRQLTGEAFFSLVKLLKYIGHLNPKARKDRPPKYSYLYQFRQIPEFWIDELTEFLSGKSSQALENLALALLDSPTACQKREETQTYLKAIQRFWRHEILPLKKARFKMNYSLYPVPQKERDFLFLRSRGEVPMLEDKLGSPALLGQD